MNASCSHASGPLHLAAALALLAASAPSAGQTLGYSIDVHSFGSAGAALGSACYRLTGTIADAASGGSANGSYTAYAGFWGATLPAHAADEIFFTGFEGC